MHLPHCWPLFPSPFTPIAVYSRQLTYLMFTPPIKRFLPFRPVTLHWHLLGLQATFLIVVQRPVCCTMQQRAIRDTRPGFLKHQTSGWHLQEAQYQLKTRPRNDCSMWPAQAGRCIHHTGISGRYNNVRESLFSSTDICDTLRPYLHTHS